MDFEKTTGTRGQEPQINPLWSKIDQLSSEIEAKAIAWRRDIHQYPELGYQELRTAKLVADHLKSLGMEVRTGVAKTGVVGILYGKKDKPVVALRADMDALAITETTNVPFASREKTIYQGKETGVMHACGHDMHTAILMATADVLSKIKDELPGTVKFIFEPNEEGTPQGEEMGGALMVKEGALESPKPDAIFGLHVASTAPVGIVGYQSGGVMAGVDVLDITINGAQAHTGMPWTGIDPVVVAAQVIMGLQTIVSRQTNLTTTPAVISISTIQIDATKHIVPKKVELGGVICVLDQKIQEDIRERIRRTAEKIAESSGATAEIKIVNRFPVSFNDPDLTRQMVPTLERIAGKGKLIIAGPVTVAETFSFYQQKIPGHFFFVGAMPKDGKGTQHAPDFNVDENAIRIGVRAMTNLAVDFLSSK